LELIINNLQIPIEKDGIDEYVNAASQKLKIGEGNISIAKMLSKSLDVSNKEQFYYKISLVVSINDSFGNKHNLPVYTEQ
jgi:uncharacterized protein